MMLSHDEAIAFFVERGFHAERRVRALGDCVVAAAEPDRSGDSGITAHAQMVWLVPRQAARWDVVHAVRLHECRRRYPGLEPACHAALEYFSRARYPDVCAGCGGTCLVSFGEHPSSSGLLWWTSSFCRSCGARIEADGVGSLPPDLRQLELARNGTWSVAFRGEQPKTLWPRLREHLQLTLEVLLEFKQQAGVVFRGTIGEALLLQSVVRATGGAADVVQVDC